MRARVSDPLCEKTGCLGGVSHRLRSGDSLSRQHFDHIFLPIMICAIPGVIAGQPIPKRIDAGAIKRRDIWSYNVSGTIQQ